VHIEASRDPDLVSCASAFTVLQQSKSACVSYRLRNEIQLSQIQSLSIPIYFILHFVLQLHACLMAEGNNKGPMVSNLTHLMTPARESDG
jgi:hypothetical protein